MKKINKFICLIMMLCIVILQFAACTNNVDDDGNNSNVGGEDGANQGGEDGENTELPTSEKQFAITTEYDLEELSAYFFSGPFNYEMYSVGVISKNLYFADVAKKFPPEITRYNDNEHHTPLYSIYKVKDGYFYVMWTSSIKEENIETRVLSSFYMPSEARGEEYIKQFDSLVIGESTAADVRAIDPYTDMNYVYSTGPYSYSYISWDQIIEIRYDIVDPDEEYNYEELVVSDIEVVSREEFMTAVMLKRILYEDFPKD